MASRSQPVEASTSYNFKVRGCIKSTSGPWIVRRPPTKNSGRGATSVLRMPSPRERENNKRRERRRRAVAARIFAGLKQHGNYRLPKHADHNEVLKALCAEAGWVVEEDGTIYRQGDKPPELQKGKESKATNVNYTCETQENAMESDGPEPVRDQFKSETCTPSSSCGQSDETTCSRKSRRSNRNSCDQPTVAGGLCDYDLNLSGTEGECEEFVQVAVDNEERNAVPPAIPVQQNVQKDAEDWNTNIDLLINEEPQLSLAARSNIEQRHAFTQQEYQFFAGLLPRSCDLLPVTVSVTEKGISSCCLRPRLTGDLNSPPANGGRKSSILPTSLDEGEPSAIMGCSSIKKESDYNDRMESRRSNEHGPVPACDHYNGRSGEATSPPSSSNTPELELLTTGDESHNPNLHGVLTVGSRAYQPFSSILDMQVPKPLQDFASSQQQMQLSCSLKDGMKGKADICFAGPDQDCLLGSTKGTGITTLRNRHTKQFDDEFVAWNSSTSNTSSNYGRPSATNHDVGREERVSTLTTSLPFSPTASVSCPPGYGYIVGEQQDSGPLKTSPKQHGQQQRPTPSPLVDALSLTLCMSTGSTQSTALSSPEYPFCFINRHPTLSLPRT